MKTTLPTTPARATSLAAAFTDRRPVESVETLKVRVRAEYREMPGLCLTLPQACRLWQIEAGATAAILDGLVAEGFLRRTARDAFKSARD